jgi:hypothetical protein
MTQFSKSPGWVNYTYADDSLRTEAFYHVGSVCVIPFATPVVGEPPTFVRKGGGSVGMAEFLDSWLNVFKTIFQDTTTFARAQFWSQPTNTDEPQFIYDLDISATAGTATDPNQIYSMQTITYRTYGGHLLKIAAMEGIIPVNQKDFYPWTGGTPQDQMNTYLQSDDCCIVARDGTYPYFPIAITSKTSDALLKKFNV